MSYQPNQREREAANLAGRVIGRLLDDARELLDAAGYPVTKALIVMELDAGEEIPTRVAASWPVGAPDEAAALCDEGAEVFRLMSIAAQAKGEG